MTAEALDRIAAEPFDLYLLDLWVPELGGLELCKRIREMDPSAHVVFYTALARETDRERAAQAGADVVLIKPRDLENVVPTITQLLEGDREGGSKVASDNPTAR